eukprot:TRINITY_DN86168_c0_g1_i1.p1 TRINITY_DN86168_c0_g1~~TRINITY_DN86168_c0_g1_i1.p1  ORF type:complete len:200 (+),score=42.05 TRINITY_DN86168_c0_g1_i1:49-600(+)
MPLDMLRSFQNQREAKRAAEDERNEDRNVLRMPSIFVKARQEAHRSRVRSELAEIRRESRTRDMTHTLLDRGGHTSSHPDDLYELIQSSDEDVKLSKQTHGARKKAPAENFEPARGCSIGESKHTLGRPSPASKPRADRSASSSAWTRSRPTAKLPGIDCTKSSVPVHESAQFSRQAAVDRRK